MLGLAAPQDFPHGPPGEITAIEDLLPRGGTFIDIGANEGQFSVVAGRVAGPTGKVIAVEPQSRLASVIRENSRLNGLSHAHHRPLAISDRDDEYVLYVSPPTNTGSPGFHRTTRYKLPTETVRCLTLTQLLQLETIQTCHFMKIDIEGHEHEAIMGPQTPFQTGQIHALILEMHPLQPTMAGHSEDDITSFLLECGYRMSEHYAKHHSIQVWVHSTSPAAQKANLTQAKDVAVTAHQRTHRNRRHK